MQLFCHQRECGLVWNLFRSLLLEPYYCKMSELERPISDLGSRKRERAFQNLSSEASIEPY